MDGPINYFEHKKPVQCNKGTNTLDMYNPINSKKINDLIKWFEEKKIELNQDDFENQTEMVEKLWEFVMKVKSEGHPKQVNTSHNINFIISDNKFLNVKTDLKKNYRYF